MRILVVGAGGILAPAAQALADRGDEVTGVALSPDGIPPGVVPLTGDAQQPDLFASGAWDTALVYLPVVTAPSRQAIRSAVAGRVVSVEVSAAADPSNGHDAAIGPDTLLLGWATGAGGPRWHTPAEVSSAAIALLDDAGASRMLGAVRPWEDRP